MKIVLDTNVLLVSISSHSKHHWIFKALTEGKYILCINNEILCEYNEIISAHLGKKVADAVCGVIENIENIRRINTYFKFNLLLDKDDNKFVDCAIAGSVDYIVTHDKDFNILKSINFPKVEVIDSDIFKDVLYSSNK